MREIKFRAWDVGNKVMVKVEHLTWGRGTEGFYELSEINEEMPKWFELMQSTGLYDKKGKEIYEGDILSHKYYSRPVVCRFDDANGCFEFDDVASGDASLEVIGNIYEHPELLEVGK